MYRPVTRGSVQLWMTRVAKRVQGNSRFVVMLVCLVLFGLWMVWGGRGTGEVRLIESGPPVVLVVVLDRYNSEGEEIKIVDKVIENRGEYAGAHGIDTVLMNLTGRIWYGSVQFRRLQTE